MVQSTKKWFDMIYMCIQAFGMNPYYYGTCLFMREHVICVVYVDDCLLFTKEDMYIDSLCEKMCDHNFEIKCKDQSITGLLILDISNTGTGNEKTIKFTMSCHIYCLMVLIVINEFNPKDTLATQIVLCRYIVGTNIKETDKWSYSATLGMLQYLSRNTPSDIELTYNHVSS